MRASPVTPFCAVCSTPSQFVGSRSGRLDARQYRYWYCHACHLRFIDAPRTDFGAIYNENYYAGHGADPNVDYAYEMHHPELTVRNYEWQGLLSIFQELAPRGARWLDFGCGCGGLVAFAR